jgi:hypothetical protein
MSSNNEVTPKEQPINTGNRTYELETGGVKFIATCPEPPNPNPQPSPNVTPTPPPGPAPAPGKAGVALDGVQMMFPENKAAKVKPFFINLTNPDSDNKVFATTYGQTTYKFEKPMKEGNVSFVRHMGAKQTYASGAPPGKSCRFHHTPDGGMFTPGKYSWKDKTIPTFLYSDKCYYNFEFTVIARPGKALGTHQSFAFKVRSRPDKPDDSLRSTIEMCMPNDQKGDAYVNFNYDHKTYAKVSGVKQYIKEGKITPNQWIGVKLVSIIANDRKSTWFGLYVNLKPIDMASGNPDNAGWKLKAEYTAKGIPEYKNIPPIWGGMTNYLRVDGYEYVDLYRYSIMEIEKGVLTHPELLQLTQGTQFEEAQPDPDPNPADFNSAATEGENTVPQQDPANPEAPPQQEVTNPPPK